MAGVSVSQDIESLFKSGLLNLAVRGQVSTCGTMIYKIVLGEEALRSRIVSGGEVYLGKPEGIVGVTWYGSACQSKVRHCSVSVPTGKGK